MADLRIRALEEFVMWALIAVVALATLVLGLSLFLVLR